MKKKEFNTLVYINKFNDEKSDWESKNRTKLALNFIGSNKKVLDVGCYDGYISEKIKQAGNEVIGLEISKEAVKICNERGINCIEHDLEEKFPFANDQFDMVFAGEIIEHIYDTDGFLQELKRVVKPTGNIVITTPNIAAFTRRIKLLFGKNPLIDIGLISPDGKDKSAGHIRYFTIKSLEQLLKRNNLIISEWKTDFILFKHFRLIKLAKLFPSLGWGLIVKIKK